MPKISCFIQKLATLRSAAPFTINSVTYNGEVAFYFAKIAKWLIIKLQTTNKQTKLENVFSKW